MTKTKKGEDYYSNLQYKIQKILVASNRRINNRNEEKSLDRCLYKVLGNKRVYAGQSIQYQVNSAYLNPNENIYTNFNVNFGNG